MSMKISIPEHHCNLKNYTIISYNRALDQISLSPCCGLAPSLTNKNAYFKSDFFLNNFDTILSTYEFSNFVKLDKYFVGNCTHRIDNTLKTLPMCTNYVDNKKILNVANSISTLCNLNCIMCGHDHSKNDREQYIYKRVTKLFENIELDSYEFTVNGEPFLHKDLIDDFIVNSKTKIIKFTTNAVLLNENYIKHLYQLGNEYNRLIKIRVSMDGITKKTYEKIRLGSNFDLVFNNILLLKKYNLLDLIQYVEQEENQDEVYSKYDFFKKYNLNYIILQKYNYTDNGKMYRYDSTKK